MDFSLYLVVISIGIAGTHAACGGGGRCPFENVAFQRSLDATSTCGNPPTRFCSLSNPGQCSTCDASLETDSHPPSFMTDFHARSNPTWWQSETLKELGQTRVNLTMDLGAEYQITYIRITFHSPRPASMAIYKRRTAHSDWEPWQYFSAACQQVYQHPDRASNRRFGPDDAVHCTSEYSDISPLSGGVVTFSTGQGRQGAFRATPGPVLQNFLTAATIRIELAEMNTFGDEVSGEERVLQSYYYAISDMAVGGRRVSD